MDVIPIPPKTLALLTEIITAQQALQAQANSIVSTLREVLVVPDDYELRDIRVGFTQPASHKPDAS